MSNKLLLKLEGAIDGHPVTLDSSFGEVRDEIVAGEYECKMDLLRLFLLEVSGQLTLVRLLEGCSVPAVAVMLLNIYFICGI